MTLFMFVQIKLYFTITGRGSLVMTQSVSHRVSLRRLESDSTLLCVSFILDCVPLELVLFFRVRRF